MIGRDGDVRPFELIRWARTQAREHELKPLEAHVLLLLATYANPQGVAWPTVRTLALDCGLQPTARGRSSQVAEALARLEELQLVWSTRGGRGRPSRRELLFNPALTSGTQDVKGVNGALTSGVQDVKEGLALMSGRQDVKSCAMPGVPVHRRPAGRTSSVINRPGKSTSKSKENGQIQTSGTPDVYPSPPSPPATAPPSRGDRRPEDRSFLEECEAYGTRLCPDADPVRAGRAVRQAVGRGADSRRQVAAFIGGWWPDLVVAVEEGAA